MPASTPRTDRSYILALGFGTAAAMWTLGYFLRIPPAPTPSWLVLVLLALCIVAGGYLAARFAGAGILGGAYPGIVAAVLNMLILGAVLGDSLTSAWLWVPGMILASGLLSLLGALSGTARFRPAAPPLNWTAVFASVAVWTTFLLVVAGGLVTSMEAGLAVVDWPNTEGQLMFVYPLAKMTGGIFYEHSHRLIGSLVGLTMLTLAIHLSASRQPRWLKSLGWLGFVLVVVQGILGGLRVTGVFTASTDPADTAPVIGLAIVHGVVGQVFLALLVALAVFTTWRWQRLPRPEQHHSASFDRSLSASVIALLVIQLVLGAIQRHIAGGLHIHITLAVIVILAIITLGVRLWGIYTAAAFLQRTGTALICIVSLQLLLGLAALAATGASAGISPPPAYSVAIATMHQATGAILLAGTVFAAAWIYKLAGPQAIAPLPPQ